MEQDKAWKEFLSDDARYADIINAFACGGEQLIRGSDLQELDTQTGYFRGGATGRKAPPAGRKRQINTRQARTRDMVRKAAFGVNFAIVGIENQEVIDYAFPLRNMSYDVGEYEKQAAGIRKAVRRKPENLTPGEYLYGFQKSSKLWPVVTIILYAGEEPWDGPRSLHEMLDFTDIPRNLQEMTQDYRINLIEIRRLQDTGMLQTDVRQVFDFIRCSGDRAALKELIDKDPSFQSMEEDAFDVMVQYGNAKELAGMKDDYRKGDRVDMCKGLADWLAEEKAEGRAEGEAFGRAQGEAFGRIAGIEEKTRIIVTNMLKRGMPDEDIRALAECDQALIDEVRNG